jgi:hypothetical protein
MGYVRDILGIKQVISEMYYINFRIYMSYPYNPTPTPSFIYKKNRGPGAWCQISRAGQVAPALASELGDSSP